MKKQNAPDEAATLVRVAEGFEGEQTREQNPPTAAVSVTFPAAPAQASAAAKS